MRIVCSTVNSPLEFLGRFKPVLLKQVHSAVIIDIDRDHELIGDGLTTRLANIRIGVKAADCLPVFLFNDERLAAIHCGWRSLYAGIVQSAMRLMGDFQYVLGAGIGPCCYEVRPDVADRFRADFPEAILTRGTSLFLDLKRCVRSIMGKEPDADLEHCVRCRADLFFSYRRGDTDRRNYAVISKE